MFRTKVYSIDPRTGAERLLFAGPIAYQGRPYLYLDWPEIDVSRHTLYLIVKTSVVEGSLFAIDLSTGKRTYLTHAGYYALVEFGEYKGDLLVEQRHFDPSKKCVFNDWSLYSPLGEKLKLVSPDMAYDTTPFTCPQGARK